MKRFAAILLLSVLTVSPDTTVFVSRISVGGGGSATATDTFERTGSNPISNPMSDGVSTWTSGPGATADVRIPDGSNANGTASDSAGRVLSPTFTANQRTTITLDSTSGVGAVVRMNSTTDADCYLLYLASSTSLQLYKVTDSGTLSFSLLTSWTITAVAANDTIGLSAEGTSTTTLRAFRNGVEQGSSWADSSSPYTTGQPGFWGNGTGPELEAFAAVDI